MTLHDVLFDTLEAALSVPVFVDVARSDTDPPYVVIASDTNRDSDEVTDRQTVADETTVTVAVYAPSGSQVRSLSRQTRAAISSESFATLVKSSGLASYVDPSLDLDATGPDQDLASDTPLASRIVRARYILR